MKVSVHLPRRTAGDVRARISAGFAAEGLDADTTGELAIKAEGDELRLAVVFVLGSTIGGALWDLEKEALRRGLRGLGRVMRDFGIGAMAEIEREQDVVIYLLPDGPQGDRALAAIERDYDGRPKGSRVWLPGEGWIPETELIAAMECAAERSTEIGDEQADEAWLAYPGSTEHPRLTA